jgi:signal transduction histidine kinase/HAMP domain-containing protein
MRLRLRTKITLFIALLVLGVVGVNSWLYLARLTRQVIQQADERAGLLTKQILFQAQNALSEAAQEGLAPASDSQGDLREYVRAALDRNATLTSLIDSQVTYSSVVYEVTIVARDGVALISSDASLPGRQALVRPPFADFVGIGFLEQLKIIYGPPQAYDVAYPFQLGPPDAQVPFGEIRVAMQTGLLANEITPALRSAAWLAMASVLISVLLAAIISNISLAPLSRISRQLDHISRGEFDHRPLQRADEFGQVSTKINLIGQQLRGVREIFGTLRENLDQILGGLEDGLLLFTRDGRAGMVSPAVEKFLGVPAGQLLGRRASEIFPAGHPLRGALRLTGEDLEAAETVEVEIPGAGEYPARRVGISVQVITEGGSQMGALVTLRDLESLERINRQLQVSEQLSAFGRVTAGVAHEVKNPLNSMRLWLENLKESLSPGDSVPRQAVAVLDSEINRLDSVVKRFLDFMRAPELHLEPTHLDQLLGEVAAIARPQMLGTGVQLEMRCASLPPVQVDRALAKQAFLNLVYNAIEAMPGGGRLTIGLERRGETAEISISDTGKGIKPEHRGRIFQLFFTTRPGGSGIGLASTYKTVQLHEGSIEFESETGQGTTFRIELPLGRAVAEAEPARTSVASSVAAQKV